MGGTSNSRDTFNMASNPPPITKNDEESDLSLITENAVNVHFSNTFNVEVRPYSINDTQHRAIF